MGVPISNVTRRVVYEASGTGPYSFSFEILANTDIAVYKDDALLTLTTDYTVTINANGTGSITLTASPTGADQIAIVGNRTIQRTTDFVTGGDFFANTVNDEMDQQTIFAQQNAEGLGRALQAPQTDPTTIDMTLPRASVRAGKVLAFDSNGDPTTGEVIGDFRGNWTSGTAYNKRDIVKDTSNSNIYYCNTAHTASGSQPISTNADSAKWTLIIDAEAASDAQEAAEAAQAAAETAETNAETAETNAETAATAAASSASAASTSASAASTSATNAASSASTASTAATNAGNSATAAASSASSASSSASSASTSATNAASSASSASTSASNASTSATNAASSASSASTSASTASTQATNAASSATAAASSATSAAASAAAAAASFDAFDDIYLGAKSSDPSVDNDGNALTTGDQYFNTTANELRVYNGSTWQAASTVGGTVTSLNVTGNTTLGDAVGDTVTVNGTATFNNADATVYGVRVGRGAGSVSTNTAVGASALAANTTGAGNTAIGYQAANANTEGEITAIGYRSLYVNTTGNNNTALGVNSLLSNTTGGNNTANGRDALRSNTTASNNTAVGYQAGYSNTTGSTLDAFGAYSLKSNTTGTDNCAFGTETMNKNTTGISNSAFGRLGLYYNTTGSYNTSLGQQALFSNTTASNNTAVGYQAMYSYQTGGDNVAVGTQAGYSINGNGNATFLGRSAGYSTTGGGNTFVGYNSGTGVTTGAKNSILGSYNGNQGGLDIRTSSNYIVLSDGDGNPQSYCSSNSTWYFGKGGTGSTYDGFVVFNGSSASSWGPVLRYTNNGTFLADAGDYANIVGSATHQYAIRCGASGGVYLAATATSWSAISDETQKNIIEPITDGLNKVASLRAVIGSYKSDEENTRHPFLIAQDVQAVLPEAVSQNDHDGETVLGLAYTEVIPLLVAAIKELKATVDAQQVEIDTLKGQA